VACIIAVMVVPAGDWSIAMTRDCFEPGSGFLRSGSPVVWADGFVTGARIGPALADFFADFVIEILRLVERPRGRTTAAPPRR
jgi:hypothetical protein